MGQRAGQPTPQQMGQQAGQRMPSRTPQQMGQPNGQRMAPPPMYGRAKPMMDTRKRNIIIGGVAAAVVLIIVAMILISNRKKKIDLNDYVTVNFSGYDTKGTASINVDYTTLASDLQNALGKKTNSYQSISDYEDFDLGDVIDALDDIGDYGSLTSGLSWDLDKTEDLSNGDKVTLTFQYDNDAAAKYKIKFVGDEKEITVDGLTSVKEIDPFENVTVEFSGTSPNASASVSHDSTENALEYVDYSLSKNSGIEKGETVTVSVEYDEEDMLESYGCVLSTTSKDFVCEDVDEYVSSLADIDETTMTSMKNQTKDVIISYFGNHTSDFKKGTLTYEGCYFLNRKTVDEWSSQNMVYVVYSTTVTSKNHAFKATKVYFPVGFDDVILYADGSGYVNLDTVDILGSTNLTYSYWYKVAGYTKKNTMHSELVASKKGEYTTEADGTLQ
jgi:hypothetical protein